jgi:hypothetical protein
MGQVKSNKVCCIDREGKRLGAKNIIDNNLEEWRFSSCNSKVPAINDLPVLNEAFASKTILLELIKNRFAVPFVRINPSMLETLSHYWELLILQSEQRNREVHMAESHRLDKLNRLVYFEKDNT